MCLQGTEGGVKVKRGWGKWYDSTLIDQPWSPAAFVQLQAQQVSLGHSIHQQTQLLQPGLPPWHWEHRVGCPHFKGLTVAAIHDEVGIYFQSYALLGIPLLS